jgi:hypothetical protein
MASDLAGRGQRGEPLALPYEDLEAELVLHLPDLLADARLRGVQGLRGVGHVHAVIDDRAQVLDLL